MLRRGSSELADGFDALLLLRLVHHALELQNRLDSLSLHELAGLVWVYRNVGVFTAGDEESARMRRSTD